jgi:PAS domain S-box-containing protein
MKLNPSAGTTDARYRGMVESVQAIVWRLDAATLQGTFISHEAETLLGYPVEAWTEPNFWQNHLHPEDLARTRDFMAAVAAGAPGGEHDSRIRAADGRTVWLRSVVRLVEVEAGRKELVGVSFDQTARHRVDALRAADLRILEMIASGHPLPRILDTLVRAIEELGDGMKGSVLLLDDGKRVRHGAAPNLPAAYVQAIDGEEIGPDRGSCGTAAWKGEPVIVEDIETSPLWHRYRELARKFGLRACWSVPIRGSAGIVLGTFALYHSQPQSPTPELLELTTHASNLAAIAIERHRREEAIVDSEAFARAVIDNALDANVIMDQAGVITGWSRRAAEIFGWTEAEAVGRKLSDLIIPERLRARHQQGLQHYLATGEGPVLQRRIEVPALHRQGHEFPVELAVSPIRQAGKTIFSAFLSDLTASRRTEEALRVTDEHLALVYRHVDDVLFHLKVEPDGNYRFASVNPAFCRSTGLDASQVIGKTVREVIPEPSLSLVLQKYDEAIRTNRTVRWEETTLYSTGPRSGDVSITPVFDSEGRPKFMVGSVRDFTDRKRLEEDVRQLQKLEAIGRLTGGVAHDFNNLLTVILGYGELLLGQNTQNAAMTEDLQEIVNAGRRASSLTRQLLAFARKQNLEPQRLDLNELIGGLEKMLRRLIREDVTFDLRLAPNLWSVMADPGQLEQVIVNLSVNARDAMPRGGRLTFETANVTVDADAARRQPDLAPGSYVALSLRDTGAGMDEETRRRIFEPFFTTKEQGKGTGLGLATVYGIVKQSGGHIEVSSDPGKGTTFRIFLSKAADAAEAGPARPSSAAHRVGGERILLVEDEPALRALGERMLKGLRYTVTVAADGEAALKAADALAVPDLLITDLVMPGMGGKELGERLLKRWPGLRILYISGYTEKPTDDPDAPTPGSTFLQKPFSVASLAAAVRKALEGR